MCMKYSGKLVSIYTWLNDVNAHNLVTSFKYTLELLTPSEINASFMFVFCVFKIKKLIEAI